MGGKSSSSSANSSSTSQQYSDQRQAVNGGVAVGAGGSYWDASTSNNVDASQHNLAQAWTTNTSTSNNWTDQSQTYLDNSNRSTWTDNSDRSTTANWNDNSNRSVWSDSSNRSTTTNSWADNSNRSVWSDSSNRSTTTNSWADNSDRSTTANWNDNSNRSVWSDSSNRSTNTDSHDSALSYTYSDARATTTNNSSVNNWTGIDPGAARISEMALQFAGAARESQGDTVKALMGFGAAGLKEVGDAVTQMTDTAAKNSLRVSEHMLDVVGDRMAAMQGLASAQLSASTSLATGAMQTYKPAEAGFNKTMLAMAAVAALLVIGARK